MLLEAPRRLPFVGLLGPEGIDGLLVLVIIDTSLDQAIASGSKGSPSKTDIVSCLMPHDSKSGNQSSCLEQRLCSSMIISPSVLVSSGFFER